MGPGRGDGAKGALDTEAAKAAKAFQEGMMGELGSAGAELGKVEHGVERSANFYQIFVKFLSKFRQILAKIS